MDASHMVELLHQHFPDLTFDISRVQKKTVDEYIVITCPEERWDVTWVEGTQTWRDLLTRINKKISHKKDTECLICNEHASKKMSCSQCGEWYCVPCYIRLFQRGHGVVVCPYCRSSVGRAHTPFEIRHTVEQIWQSIGSFST